MISTNDTVGRVNTIQFSDRDLIRFADWSGNRNPLHLTPSCLPRSSPASPLVHAVLLAIKALETVAEEAEGCLESLDIEFHNTVMVGDQCIVRSRWNDGRHVELSVLNADRLVLAMRGSIGTIDSTAAVSQRICARNETTGLRHEAADRNIDDLHIGFQINGTYCARAVPGHYLSISLLSKLQLQVLALCSYLAGMEIPGLHSLLRSLRIKFYPLKTEAAAFSYRVCVTHCDPKLRLLNSTIEVNTPAGDRAASAEMCSYLRFSSLATDYRTLAAALPDGDALHGKVALVCGGTRGLGADITAALALAGCEVYTSYQKSAELAQRLVDRLNKSDTDVTLLRGDAGDLDWCQRTLNTILHRHQRLDFVVLNACSQPVPLPLGMAADSARHFDDYFQGNLKLVQNPLSVFLPAVNACHGAIVAVSSRHVSDPSPQLAHYVALKQAVERLMYAAAREFKAAAFILVRPPRLQTIWNDSPNKVLDTIPPMWVAARLVTHLIGGCASSAVETLDEFPPLAVNADEGSEAEERTSSRLSAQRL